MENDSQLEYLQGSLNHIADAATGDGVVRVVLRGEENVESASCSVSSLDIGGFIAHHNGTREVDVMPDGGFKQKFRRRFTAVALLLRGMRTYQKILEGNALPSEKFLNPLVDAAHVIDGEESTAYSGLVCNYDKQVSGSAKLAERLCSARNQSDTVGIREVARILYYSSIPVQKYRFVHCDTFSRNILAVAKTPLKKLFESLSHSEPIIHMKNFNR